jgi:ribose transport system permease protein
MLATLLVVCLVVWLSNALFLSPANVTNTTREISRLGIYALGIAAVIVTGGIDLSIGSIVGLTGVIIAKISSNEQDCLGQPLWVGISLAMGCAVAVGFVQGSLITRMGLQPFIVTLGFMLLLRGVAQVITGGRTLSFGDSPLPPAMEAELVRFGRWTVLTTPTLVLLVVAALMTYLLHFTVFGRYLYAIGGGRDAAEYSGVPVKRVETLAYVISATLAGVAGVVETSYGSMMHTNGIAYELYAIAAAVIGGVSLRGGEGSVPGVLIGSALLRVIYNGINLFEYTYRNAEGTTNVFRIGPEWEYVIVGLVILMAVVLDQVVHMVQARRRTRRTAAAARSGPAPAPS